jgi:hypothetical protein
MECQGGQGIAAPLTKFNCGPPKADCERPSFAVRSGRIAIFCNAAASL